jgi:putative FmdB family regulatory protein
MPTYDYKCQNCDSELNDIYQSFKDEALVKCSSCGKNSLARVIYGGLGCFVKDVKTIGQLADSNYKKMGSYKRSEIEESKKKENTQPQYGKASSKQINKMNSEQKKKYIITGET